MKIFISHIHEESKLALVLKDWIESTFAGQCDVFVSSDIDDIPAGAKWLDRIDSALGNSKVFITMCSPNSIIRPWINFETGCAWIKQTPVIPICYSGLSKSNLPQPLSMFQALDLEEDGFPKILFDALGKYLGFVKLPRIAFDEMLIELRAAIAQISGNAPNSSEQNTTTEQARLPEIQEKILKVLAEIRDHDVYAGTLATNFKIHIERIQYHLDKLVEIDYLFPHYNMVSPTTYSLTTKGRAYIVENEII